MAGSFREANQARVSLKMMLSNHAWYGGSVVENCDGEYCVIVNLHYFDKEVRKLLSPTFNGVSVKTEVLSK